MTDLDPAEFFESARRAAASCAGGTAAEQAARLAEDGLLGVLAPEAAGGLALPLRFAVPVVAAASGALLSLPLVETLLLARIAPVPIAAALVAGETIGTISWDCAVDACETSDGVVLDGVVGRAPGTRDAGWVLARLRDGRAALVATSAGGLAVGDADGFDLAVPEGMLRLTGVAVPSAHVLPADACDGLIVDAEVLRAAAMLGSAELCLAAAVEHATNRRQFGKALIANQAMRHLLARQKLQLENLRGVLNRALAPNAAPIAARVAFAAACQYGPAIIEGAIQVHGGMGFTWDLDLHRHLRHLRMLEAHGDGRGVRAAIAAHLIDSNAA
ncbi:MAG: acyl-CoA/acyl-ACP dehydrogenase [Alphaproteobacteria bacterium]|nr:acyl-CoA/acyl-ACP dehydrogenase [Alphaproteobacteria bacterium]